MNDKLSINEPTAADYVVKNRLQAQDEALHSWYRFVLGYPPHLVREYLVKLEADPERDWVLDPFCGTATTPVEARLRGFDVTGTDANPIALLASRVKLNWAVNLESVQRSVDDVSAMATSVISRAGLPLYSAKPRQLKLLETAAHDYSTTRDTVHVEDPLSLLPEAAHKLIPSGFISPKPLTRVLSIRSAIEQIVKDLAVKDFLFLALATTIVASAGNVGFGPEVYRLPPKDDADVLGHWRTLVERMMDDMRWVQTLGSMPTAYVAHDDARVMKSLTEHPPIGIVILSLIHI